MEHPNGFDWYVLKVQTNREASIRAALERRVQRDGQSNSFGRIIIPTEKVIESRSGKKCVKDRKMFPGYLFLEMSMSDDAWYLVRDITGVGDFTGSMGKPQPMSGSEVERMLGNVVAEEDKPKKFLIEFRPGDAVKVNSGPFEAFDGTVESVDDTSGNIAVLIEIFGRPTPVEFEYHELERS